MYKVSCNIYLAIAMYEMLKDGYIQYSHFDNLKQEKHFMQSSNAC